MTNVILHLDECHESFLPHLCICCGQPTSQFIERSIPLESPGVLPSEGLGGIMNLARTTMIGEAVDFKVPICLKHQSHWLVRKAVVIFGGMSLVFSAIVYQHFSPELENRFGMTAFYVYAALFVVGIAFLFRFWIRRIRFAGLEENELIFVNVHELFREMVLRKQHAAQEAYELRKLSKELERLKVQYPHFNEDHANES